MLLGFANLILVVDLELIFIKFIKDVRLLWFEASGRQGMSL